MASTQFQNAPEPPRAAMTTEEAEQVMALWAERQQQLHAMPSVRELSEVLSAPPSEVASLLDQVRRQNGTKVEKPKKSLTGVRKVAIVAGILMLMGFSGGLGWLSGWESGVSGARYRGRSYPAQYNPSSPGQYRVTFDGYTLPRGTTTPTDERILAGNLESAMAGAISQMSPQPGIYAPSTLSSEDFLKKLQANEKVAGLLDFRKAVIKGPAGSAEALIPVFVADHPEWQSTLESEQQRRIKQLVSQAIQKS